MIGSTILHYRILEKLGEGGMGIVYKAHDTTLDRNVALKFLPHYLTTDSNEKERFYHEARAAAALMHQNVAVIYEVSDYEGQVFISMEYVEGETIKKIIENKSESLTIKKVLEIAIQVCEGLASAHKKNIVHRDIKSDNIMLNSDGQAKITDFGLAKLKGATKLTKEGSTVGTAAYMSPEQARGEEVDSRSDIFSFGVVLYEMLTTYLPSPGEYQEALLYSLLNETPQPVARFNGKVSQDFERVVFKALEKDKEERYQHIDDLLADLRKERKNLEYARSGYVKASTINQISKEKTPIINIKNLRIIIPVAVVVLLVAIFFIINPFNLLGQKPTSEKPRNSLAVMYFEDIPDPEDKDHTGEMLTNLLITSLSQVKGLAVISRERLLDIQKDLGQTDTKIISQSLASKIAKRAGVTTMLTGSIIQKTPKLAVTTRLINVQSGEIVSSLQLKNFSADQIFELVDSLSYLLRNNFKIASTQPTEIKPVSDVTTKSPEAYRAYVAGLELIDKYTWGEAGAAFERAIELDSSFAMAYYYYSKYSGVRNSLKFLQKAVELSGRVTERERLTILAENYRINNKSSKAIEIYEKLIKEYPVGISTYFDLGFWIYQNQLIKPEKAVTVYQAGLKVNPSAKKLWNGLAYAYAQLNQKQQALNAVDKYVALAPAEPNPYDSKGDIYAWFQDYDSSRIEYLKAIKLRSDFGSATKLGFYAVLRGQFNDAKRYFQMDDFKFPVIEMHRGQIKSALKKLLEHLNAQASAREREITLFVIMHLYYETGQFPEMLKFTNNYHNGSKKNPKDVISGRGRDYRIWALVKNGKSIVARETLDDLQKDAADKGTILQVKADYSSALISFEEKNYELALQKFKKAFSKLPPNHEPNIFYAVTLLKRGKLTEAIKEFNRLLYWPATMENYLLPLIPGCISCWPIPAVKAHYWLGVAYEQQGQKDKAIKEYEKFLDIWKDADFNSPEIKDAKMRVSKLKEVALK